MNHPSICSLWICIAPNLVLNHKFVFKSKLVIKTSLLIKNKLFICKCSCLAFSLYFLMGQKWIRYFLTLRRTHFPDSSASICATQIFCNKATYFASLWALRYHCWSDIDCCRLSYHMFKLIVIYERFGLNKIIHFHVQYMTTRKTLSKTVLTSNSTKHWDFSTKWATFSSSVSTTSLSVVVAAFYFVFVILGFCWTEKQ